MPRYYKNKIFTKEQREYQAFWTKSKMIELEELQRTEFEKVNKGSITFDEYIERLRIGGYERFYRKQKKRNE